MPRRVQILLIEDEPIDAMTVKRAVRSRELPVDLEVVECAEDALDRLREGRGERQGQAYAPDLILADLRLPQLSGLDLLERVKADPGLRGIPFVLLSTSSQESEVEMAYDLGAAGYFVKPVAFEDYADVIETVARFSATAQPPVGPERPAPTAAPQSDMHYLQSELQAILRDDPRMFDLFQDGATDGIWYWDLESPEHEWMSSGFWQTFGYDPSTKPHRASAWQDMIDPDDLEVVLSNFEKHCADPAYPYDQVARYRHVDGSIVFVRCRGFAIRDRDGKPVRMLGIHRDVTEAETARARSADIGSKLREIDELLDSVARPHQKASAASIVDRIRAILAPVARS